MVIVGSFKEKERRRIWKEEEEENGARGKDGVCVMCVSDCKYVRTCARYR